MVSSYHPSYHNVPNLNVKFPYNNHISTVCQNKTHAAAYTYIYAKYAAIMVPHKNLLTGESTTASNLAHDINLRLTQNKLSQKVSFLP